MELSFLNEASTSSESPPVEILSVEEDALELWVSDDEEGVAIADLLKKLLETWNKRIRLTFRGRILHYVKRALAIHGVPFTEITGSVSNYRSDFNFKYIPTCSVRDFFYEISNIEGRIRRAVETIEAQYLAYDKMEKPFRQTFLLDASPLVRLLIFARKLDYKSVAYHLGSIFCYRCYSTMLAKRRYLTIGIRNRENTSVEYPIFIMMVLQILLSSKTNPRTNLRYYLRRLTFNASKVIGCSYRIPIVDVLTELLFTTLALGYDDIATEIVLHENRLSGRQKQEEDLFLLHFGKLLLFYNKFLKGDMSENAKIRLAEDAMILYEGSLYQTLYLPAISLRAQAGIESREEERFSLVVDLMTSQPQYLPQLVDVLNSTKLDDNIIDAVEIACTKGEENIHESHDVWLIFCKDRIRKPEKFGVIQDVLLKCMDRLFRFLDYASNRNNSSAWALLWILVQKVSPESVKDLWEERQSWWPKFHSKPLSDSESDKYKSEVLTALTFELA